ncbi:MAG: starch synthase [Betaproteobacteria bacterium RIFCSPLOWO2_12_FULL_67_28]|nr:MAG: starch synthase [Betaproteobacteria bacterium RIFCSPLOWO2_12_FULL_67_28]
MPEEPLRVLFAAPECAPLVKTGGLGDVCASLPVALRRLGVDVRLMLPAYPGFKGVLQARREGMPLPALGGFPAAQVVRAMLPGGLPAFLVDCPALYERPGGPYQDEHGRDWDDNPIRFALLARAAALVATSPPDWRAQLVHCNDWQTALAPAYLAFGATPRPATVITVHNLAFQGIFPPPVLARLGLPPESFSIDGVEFHGQVSFLKAGLQYADAITTVSPSYAREIRQAPLGFGLEGLLQRRSAVLSGILNGIDVELWNPATDPLIERRYDAANLHRKTDNKAALQACTGLAREPAVPLIGVVSRLTQQKGLDFLLEAAAGLLRLPAQLVVLGTGEAQLEYAFRELARAHPRQVSVTLAFDEPLAHRIEAGADLFAMPSRFEPCGMNQMYSQRYGTIPVVRATGGLADSVIDCTPTTLANGSASGFLFETASAPALLAAIERALAAYREPALWQRLQRQAMARDFGWDASARAYAALYARIAS